MLKRIVIGMRLAVASPVMLACSPQRSSGAATLTFLVESVADEEWSHFDDGTFDVHHPVTACVAAHVDLP